MKLEKTLLIGKQAIEIDSLKNKIETISDKLYELYSKDIIDFKIKSAILRDTLSNSEFIDMINDKLKEGEK